MNGLFSAGGGEECETPGHSDRKGLKELGNPSPPFPSLKAEMTAAGQMMVAKQGDPVRGLGRGLVIAC